MILRRALDFKFDRIVGKRADIIEFIGNTQHDSGGISPVGHEIGVVRQAAQILIDPFAGKLPGDNKFAVDIAFQSQVSPFVKEFVQIYDEWCIAEVRELFPVGISLRHHLVRDVKLHVIAVGTYDGLREPDGGIASRPMECRFQDDLFRRVAL